MESDLLGNNYTNYHTLLVSDFNAHTSVQNDFIVLPDDILEELDTENSVDVFKSVYCKSIRYNKDKTKVDIFGKKLLQFCKDTGLCIYNGRFAGDECGEYTTSKKTCIDYLIGSTRLITFYILCMYMILML